MRMEDKEYGLFSGYGERQSANSCHSSAGLCCRKEKSNCHRNSNSLKCCRNERTDNTATRLNCRGEVVSGLSENNSGSSGSCTGGFNNGCTNGCNFGCNIGCSAANNTCGMPAIVSIELQQLYEVYDVEKGFGEGTIFPCLNKPFSRGGTCK